MQKAFTQSLCPQVQSSVWGVSHIAKDGLSSSSLAYFDYWPCIVSWSFCEFAFLDPPFFPVVPGIQLNHLLKKGTKEERNTTWELLQAKANLGSLSTLTKSISTIPNVVLLYILTHSERKGLLKFEDLMNKLRFLSDSSKIGDKERHKFQVQSFKRCNDSTCDQGTIYSVIQLLPCCYPLQRAFY